MKLNLSNILTIGGFIILGIVNHYQLKFKVLEIDANTKVKMIEIKLDIRNQFDDLKKELKVSNIVLNRE